ncbi:molybdopterin adenylyltransferase [Rhodobacter xanthinilyticus]|uniref:Molybdopterin adenylyltransferase n=1 Tax=Rhodobacter xanthinilyticus TaxID=1850250 RepID=A0A1D9MAU9_9RHOB|nr:molybdopterin adenylyltransferase [Rhodobacter xanthinilyticus]AOZ68849.1 molybdopterin adenylyltransferase [Rhodobacter xanthinilyticus]
MSVDTPLIAILVASDRAARGAYEDLGGPAAEAWLRCAITTPVRYQRQIVPDGRETVAAALRALADEQAADLILVTGGTGPAERDQTPEAFDAVIDKRLPGFGEAMRLASLAEVPTAILSRQDAGVRGRSLIITLPGKPSAISTCLEAVFRAVPYCLDLIGAARIETDPGVCDAFRPKSS